MFQTFFYCPPLQLLLSSVGWSQKVSLYRNHKSTMLFTDEIPNAIGVMKRSGQPVSEFKPYPWYISIWTENSMIRSCCAFLWSLSNWNSGVIFEVCIMRRVPCLLAKKNNYPAQIIHAVGTFRNSLGAQACFLWTRWEFGDWLEWEEVLGLWVCIVPARLLWSAVATRSIHGQMELSIRGLLGFLCWLKWAESKPQWTDEGWRQRRPVCLELQ